MLSQAISCSFSLGQAYQVRSGYSGYIMLGQVRTEYIRLGEVCQA